MAIGSPNGAIFSKVMCSPGMQPISNNLIRIGLSSMDRMIAFSPFLSSDKFIEWIGWDWNSNFLFRIVINNDKNTQNKNIRNEFNHDLFF